MDMLVNNVRIAKAVCAALQTRPVSHVVYISSDAVYKDSREALTEASCAEPESLHGVMHLTREVALKQAYAGPLAIVRPTLVYGYEDPHNGYGPNRFRRLAADGKNIVLFGEGEELRDHVYVADIAAMVRLILIYGSSGLANAASGTVTSFRELANHAASAFGAASTITSVPRKGPMPHGGYRHFNNSAVLAAFPGFRFTPWREGLSEVYHRQLKEAQGCHYQS
jgi:nucleoside-diphosphate-sugar epimerase